MCFNKYSKIFDNTKMKKLALDDFRNDFNNSLQIVLNLKWRHFVKTGSIETCNDRELFCLYVGHATNTWGAGARESKQHVAVRSRVAAKSLQSPQPCVQCHDLRYRDITHGRCKKEKNKAIIITMREHNDGIIEKSVYFRMNRNE